MDSLITEYLSAVYSWTASECYSVQNILYNRIMCYILKDLYQNLLCYIIKPLKWSISVRWEFSKSEMDIHILIMAALF